MRRVLRRVDILLTLADCVLAVGLRPNFCGLESHRCHQCCVNERFVLIVCACYLATRGTWYSSNLGSVAPR